jgi:hypothetical protein
MHLCRKDNACPSLKMALQWLGDNDLPDVSPSRICPCLAALLLTNVTSYSQSEQLQYSCICCSTNAEDIT